MKGNEQVIGVFNQVLRKELTGINQYFIHAKMCANWGYERLYKVLWEESMGEMKHADRIIERILFLEGIPNISAYDRILVGTGIQQQLENDLSLETAALAVLHPGIKTCMEASDDSSRELLEHIVVDEEKHIDWIEAQLHQINEVGYQKLPRATNPEERLNSWRLNQHVTSCFPGAEP
jgi:bacterioferritin